jgi:anti-sigma factor RsiW
MKWFFNRCSRQRRNLSLLASGLLSERKRGEVKNHLTACADCQKYIAEIKATIQPLVAWEKHFARVAPAPAIQMRWTKAIHAADRSESLARFSPRIFLDECWRQLIWPSRRIWAGLAAAWLLILVANLNLKTGGPHLVATSSPVSTDFIMAWREQEKMMAELIERSESKSTAPPKRYVPQPRSERHEDYFTI